MVGSFECRIISPEAVLFSGAAEALTVVDAAGEMQILPGHAETFVALANGQVTVQKTDGTTTSFDSTGGVLHFYDGTAAVVL